MRRGSWFAAVLCCTFVLVSFSRGQQKPAKALTPEEMAFRRQEDEHARLQAEGKQVFAAEMAREQAGDCKDAQTTYDSNICFSKETAITDQNLKRFEEIIRKLQMLDTSDDSSTPDSSSLTTGQHAEEFDRMEQNWRQYRDTACKAAYDQFEGGTGGPSFDMECRLKLTRDQMRELDFIYGEDLHM
jgi:uncharacterized protein YecT (DUF1311 family)